MIRHTWHPPVGEDEPAIIYVFADTHFGNPGVDYKKLRRHIGLCQRENAGWIHLGDWVEGITPKDRRHDTRTPSTIMSEYRKARNIFAPIADQGIAILSGNHDEYISGIYGDNLIDVADYLDVPYLGYSGFVQFMMDSYGARKSYTIFLHHGHGAGRLLGARAINLQRLSGKFEADIYLVGHTHTYLQHADEYIGLKSSSLRHPRMEKRIRYYANAPSYFETYVEDNGSNYGERAAFYPQPTGCLRMEFNHSRLGKQHNWTVEIRAVLE